MGEDKIDVINNIVNIITFLELRGDLILPLEYKFLLEKDFSELKEIESSYKRRLEDKKQRE